MSGTLSNSEKLQRLLAWFKENKVTYNEEAIQIVERTATKTHGNIVSDGFGVLARRDLVDEEPLVVNPKAAVISPATSPLANLFDDEQLGGSLALCISVIYEMSLGADSPWSGYLQSLPRRADIPLLWNDEAKAWLEGTDVGKQLQEVVSKYPYVFRFEQFLDVTSLVSSRAFMVDTAGENVHIESEEMVCPLCGEATIMMGAVVAMTMVTTTATTMTMVMMMRKDAEEWESDDDEATWSRIPESEAEGNGGNPTLTTRTWTVDDEESDDDDESKWIDTLDMVVVQPCRANNEVFNTYGEQWVVIPAPSIDDVLEAFKVAVSEDRAMAVAELIAEYPESFQIRHRAMAQEEEEEEERIVKTDEEEEDKTPPRFSIDAPGHPSLSLAVLLSLGFSDEAAFTQTSSILASLSLPPSVTANKDSLMKKRSVSLVCRAAYMLAEKRLSMCNDNALGAKPTDLAQLERWETVKQLRANERKTLQNCVKTYKKAVTKLN
ncbi:SET domain-containing protein [Linderina pennispora]|uniref:SET domain-containing protein n=1 Tax=Linderina pennispora TaxID=61395 RepID=A0A1Y1WEW2_9FUNG|nr:SET domain-containing protein [Linderina pennispora]ORX72069.1 SET domain-containing protein [Linderina pennispora]